MPGSQTNHWPDEYILLRGACYGALFSIPLWALIIYVICQLTHCG